MELSQLIIEQLNIIQAKNNFNPDIGPSQVSSYPQLQFDFGKFQLCIDIIRQLELKIEIPYDPHGLNPIEKFEELKNIPQYIYFIRYGETNRWKIGISHDPISRKKKGQTFVPDDLVICFQFKADILVESNIKRYLKNYRIRSNDQSEQFELPYEAVEDIVARGKSGDLFGNLIPLRKKKYYED